MAKNSWIGPALLLGGAYFVWRSGMLNSLLGSVTPATSPVSTPSTMSAFQSFASINYTTPIHTDVTDNPNTPTGSQASPVITRSLKSNGANWILYSGGNYTGSSVATNGVDYPDATALLAPLGGVIGSIRHG